MTKQKLAFNIKECSARFGVQLEQHIKQNEIRDKCIPIVCSKETCETRYELFGWVDLRTKVEDKENPSYGMCYFDHEEEFYRAYPNGFEALGGKIKWGRWKQAIWTNFSNFEDNVTLEDYFEQQSLPIPSVKKLKLAFCPKEGTIVEILNNEQKPSHVGNEQQAPFRRNVLEYQDQVRKKKEPVISLEVMREPVDETSPAYQQPNGQVQGERTCNVMGRVTLDRAKYVNNNLINQVDPTQQQLNGLVQGEQTHSAKSEVTLDGAKGVDINPVNQVDPTQPQLGDLEPREQTHNAKEEVIHKRAESVQKVVELQYPLQKDEARQQQDQLISDMLIDLQNQNDQLNSIVYNLKSESVKFTKVVGKFENQHVKQNGQKVSEFRNFFAEDNSISMAVKDAGQKISDWYIQQKNLEKQLADQEKNKVDLCGSINPTKTEEIHPDKLKQMTKGGFINNAFVNIDTSQISIDVNIQSTTTLKNVTFFNANKGAQFIKFFVSNDKKPKPHSQRLRSQETLDNNQVNPQIIFENCKFVRIGVIISHQETSKMGDVVFKNIDLQNIPMRGIAIQNFNKCSFESVKIQGCGRSGIYICANESRMENVHVQNSLSSARKAFSVEGTNVRFENITKGDVHGNYKEMFEAAKKRKLNDR